MATIFGLGRAVHRSSVVPAIPIKHNLMHTTASTLRSTMPRKSSPSSEFGQRLLDARRARGLTQIQLAQLIGSSQRALSSYETVADFPPPAVIVKLAKVLKVSTDELFGIQKPTISLQAKQDPETKRLWKQFQQIKALPEKDRRAVIRLINFLVAATKSA